MLQSARTVLCESISRAGAKSLCFRCESRFHVASGVDSTLRVRNTLPVVRVDSFIRVFAPGYSSPNVSSFAV